MPGEGAFYGPKIDIHMEDSLGRALAARHGPARLQMPQRFGLTYRPPTTTEDAGDDPPRAVRLAGALHRHPASSTSRGAFPFWLAPVQVRVLPVGLGHVEKARAIAAQIPYRVELDESDETVGKRIRNAELEKVPFTLVVGDARLRGVARGPRARRRAVARKVAVPIPVRLATSVACKAGAKPFLTSRAAALGGSTECG